MRKHGGLQEAGALSSWAWSGFFLSVWHPLLRWRFNVSASKWSTWSTTSRGKLEQAFGLRELHPSFTQQTFVRSVPKMKTVYINLGLHNDTLIFLGCYLWTTVTTYFKSVCCFSKVHVARTFMWNKFNCSVRLIYAFKSVTLHLTKLQESIIFSYVLVLVHRCSRCCLNLKNENKRKPCIMFFLRIFKECHDTRKQIIMQNRKSL